MVRFGHRVFAGAFVVAVGFTTGELSAAVLEEVIVTAQKREQNVQDVGIAVTALSGDQINQLGLTSAQMVTEMAPGVQIMQPNGVSAFSFAIRGVIQGDFADHQEAPVSLYVDEAYISQVSGAGFLLFDLDRVEILRGPQGTLFGRNATGGLAHFITRKPTEELSGYAEVKLGSWDQVGFEGAIGGGIIDGVAGRLSMSMNQHDPYVRNRVGKDLNDGNEYAVRGQLSLDFGDNINLLLNGRAYAMEIDTGGAHSLTAFADPTAAVPIGRHLPQGQGLANPFRPPDAPVCPDCDFFGFNEPDDDIFTGSFDKIGFNDLHSYGGGGRLTWDFSHFRFTSITDWYHIDKDYQEDSDMGPTPAVNFFLKNDVEQFSQEVRFNGELERTRWVAGFYYLNIDGDYATGFEAPSSLSTIGGGIVAANDLVPVFGVPHPSGFIALDDFWNTETTSWSVFGQVEYDILPRWTAIVGFRLIDEEKEQDYESNLVIVNESQGPQRGGNPNNILGVPFFDFDKNSVGDLATWENSDLWSAKIGLDWRATDDTLIYLSWNRGIKGGGFNAPLDPTTSEVLNPVGLPAAFGGTQQNQLIPFDEEILNAYELGIKQTLLDGRVRVNASGFYYDYTDFQAFLFSGLSQTVFNNDAEIFGGEIEVFASPVRGLDMMFGVAYLDATVEDIDLGLGPEDKIPPRSPDWNVNGRVRYEYPEVFSNTWFRGHFAVQADFTYKSEFFFILTNSPAGRQDGYVIGNVRGSYTTSDGRWEAAVHVYNVADQDYFTQTFDLASSFGESQHFIDRPRWVTGTLRFTWD